MLPNFLTHVFAQAPEEYWQAAVFFEHEGVAFWYFTGSKRHNAKEPD
jgi:hypothetical protein